VRNLNCILDNDDKEGVTAIAAMSTASEKLPLTVIGKGKADRSLRAITCGRKPGKSILNLAGQCRMSCAVIWNNSGREFSLRALCRCSWTRILHIARLELTSLGCRDATITVEKEKKSRDRILHRVSSKPEVNCTGRQGKLAGSVI
jgi:hypothetical protein